MGLEDTSFEPVTLLLVRIEPIIGPVDIPECLSLLFVDDGSAIAPLDLTLVELDAINLKLFTISSFI